MFPNLPVFFNRSSTFIAANNLAYNAALQPSRHLPQKFVNTTGLAEALKFNKHTTLAASAASAG